MRLLILPALLVLAGCSGVTFGAPNGYTPHGTETCPACDAPPAAVAAYNQVMRENSPASPEEKRRSAQEDELLERALTGSPDYTAAVRRAAVANVDGSPRPAMGYRNRALELQAREQRIAVEEARLSDEIEKRRRARLAANEQQNRSARDQQAIATCQARGQQIDAAYYNPRSLLNLEGMAASNQARNACLEAYQRTGILP